MLTDISPGISNSVFRETQIYKGANAQNCRKLAMLIAMGINLQWRLKNSSWYDWNLSPIIRNIALEQTLNGTYPRYYFRIKPQE